MLAGCPDNFADGKHKVQCTYIAIPQVHTTYSVLLSRIEWMWGAEHGTNEHGVVIGNEAVWTRAEDESLSEKRLLGMDLLRLGLERGSTARNALDVITDLLETHGQGGPCAEGDSSFTYHNSFLIADATEAWILETAGRQWVAERVTSGGRNISNTLTIRKQYDLHSNGLYDYARKYKLWDGQEQPLDWASCYGEGCVEECESPYSRQSCGRSLLEQHDDKKFCPTDMMEVLRSHKGGICMHGGFETAAAMVSAINSNKQHRHWMIDEPHPCQKEFMEQPAFNRKNPI